MPCFVFVSSSSQPTVVGLHHLAGRWRLTPSWPHAYSGRRSHASLTLGVYAAREFETSDLDLADALSVFTIRPPGCRDGIPASVRSRITAARKPLAPILTKISFPWPGGSPPQ